MADMTRGQFLYRLVQELGLRVDARVVGAGFSDTDGSYLDAVVTAALNAGIITSARSFRVTDAITREEAATMIARGFDLSPTGGGSSFSDVSSGRWYSDSIAAVEDAGIFSGVGGGRFGLGDAFQTQHFDVMIGRALRNRDGPTPVNPNDPDTNPYDDDDDDDDWTDEQREDHIRAILGMLDESYDMRGTEITEWVRDMMVSSITTSEEIQLALRETQAFRTRFRMITERSEGGGTPMSVEDVLNFESGVRSLMVAAGMPAGFYDSFEDFVELGANNWSVAAIAEKIELVFERVTMAPTEVREAYASMFGVHGDEALAAYLLDPTKATPALEREVRAAEVRGMADKFNIGLSTNRALDLADLGVSMEMGFTGFQRLASMQPVFSETFAESGDDITAEEEGVGAEFDGDVDARRSIEKRISGRTSAFAGGGGSLITEEGVLGAG